MAMPVVARTKCPEDEHQIPDTYGAMTPPLI
jgi:hypothetical protein